MSEINSLHEPFKAWLKKQGLPYVNPRSDVKSGISEGWPDFTVVRLNRVALVEFKHGKGKLSPKQVERIDELRLAGCETCVAYDLPTAINHVSTTLGLTEAAGGAVAAQNETSVGAPKEYLVPWKSGTIVVARNPQGHIGFVRMMKEADAGLPRWTEALGW